MSEQIPLDPDRSEDGGVEGATAEPGADEPDATQTAADDAADES